MFKLPNNLPTSQSTIHELADYFEWLSIVDGTISLNEAIKPILLINDEIDINGLDDETDQLNSLLDGVLNEFDRRYNFSNNLYPFILEKHGYRLSSVVTNRGYWIYVYLLLCTRLNMKSNSCWNNIDGTLVFEELSSLVAKSYFGDRAECFVFGTATKGGFEQKINNLITALGEGKEFVNRTGGTVQANDDKLDIVVWKSFSDKQLSKLIAFGQCKTGTSWDDNATIELQPADFCKKWFANMTIAVPVKMFFCTQYFPLDNYNKAINAGVVFDRFRIMDFLPKLDTIFSKKIEDWCKMAIAGTSDNVPKKSRIRGSGKKNPIKKTATTKKTVAKKTTSKKSTRK